MSNKAQAKEWNEFKSALSDLFNKYNVVVPTPTPADGWFPGGN